MSLFATNQEVYEVDRVKLHPCRRQISSLAMDVWNLVSSDGCLGNRLEFNRLFL